MMRIGIGMSDNLTSDRPKCTLFQRQYTSVGSSKSQGDAGSWNFKENRMPRQTSRPSAHDRQSVQDTVAEAVERDLTRVQARLMAVCNTVATGGHRYEMACLTGLLRNSRS